MSWQNFRSQWEELASGRLSQSEVDENAASACGEVVVPHAEDDNDRIQSNLGL
jgi:hypothetical protein